MEYLFSVSYKDILRIPSSSPEREKSISQSCYPLTPSAFVRPTVGVTGRWAGVGNVGSKKNPKPEKCSKTRRVSTVECTLC